MRLRFLHSFGADLFIYMFEPKLRRRIIDRLWQLRVFHLDHPSKTLLLRDQVGYIRIFP